MPSPTQKEIPLEEFVSLVGVESAAQLRKRLNRQFGLNDGLVTQNPTAQLLINSVVQLTFMGRKATSPDSLTKIVSAIRGCISTLQEITGKGKITKDETKVNPLDLLSDEELEARHKEFAAILGESPRQKLMKEAN